MKCKLIFWLLFSANLSFAQSINDEKAAKQKALEFLLNNMEGFFSL